MSLDKPVHRFDEAMPNPGREAGSPAPRGALELAVSEVRRGSMLRFADKLAMRSEAAVFVDLGGDVD